MSKHTPAPWSVVANTPSLIADHDGSTFVQVTDRVPGLSTFELRLEEIWANARLIAAAPDMLEALRLHLAWSDSERAGPDYGGQTRDSHPDGEVIWRAWWDNQLDLCRRATEASVAAIAKAEGRP